MSVAHRMPHSSSVARWQQPSGRDGGRATRVYLVESSSDEFLPFCGTDQHFELLSSHPEHKFNKVHDPSFANLQQNTSITHIIAIRLTKPADLSAASRIAFRGFSLSPWQLIAMESHVHQVMSTVPGKDRPEYRPQRGHYHPSIQFLPRGW